MQTKAKDLANDGVAIQGEVVGGPVRITPPSQLQEVGTSTSAQFSGEVVGGPVQFTK